MNSFISIVLLIGNSLFNHPAQNCKHVDIEAEAMNILYIGVDNPVKITAHGYENISVEAMGAGITHLGGELYSARPVQVGLEKVIVTIETDAGNETTTKEFRVRRIPDPYIYILDSKGSVVTAARLKAAVNITVKNPDMFFQLPYEVIQMNFIYIPKEGNRVELQTNTAAFTQEILDLKSTAKPGDYVIISVVVKLSDGRAVPVTTGWKVLD